MESERVNRILVADDHHAFRTVICDILGVVQPQLNIFQACNGREAVDLAIGEKPDLILMDTSMPVMDGYEAARTLQNNPETKKIPVIGMSTEGDRRSIVSELRTISDGFLYKPFFMDELMQIIARLDRPAA